MASELLEVVCAVIVHDGRVLAARRKPGGDAGGKWEFPGGKVKRGESYEEAICREITEELSCSVKVVQVLKPNVHRYPSLSLRLTPIVCSLAAGLPVALEHQELAWLCTRDLPGIDWAAADLPVVDQLISGVVEGLS